MITLEEILVDIDKSVEELITLGKETAETHALYSYDLFCAAILNRSVNILRGFNTLIRDNNFIAAAPLVRIHLDSLLRLYASTLISYNVDEFAVKVIGGKQISNLMDRHGNKMRDIYLALEISKIDGLEWIQDVYKTGSGHIHFSNFVTRSSLKLHTEKDGTLISTIGKHDEFIPSDEKIGAAIRMNQISTNIAALINLWKKQKEEYKKTKFNNGEHP